MKYRNVMHVVMVLSLSVLSVKAFHVDLKKSEITCLLGNIDYFYKEYNASEFQSHEHGSIISFPIEDCDHVPIKKFNDIRWFYTSALQGERPEYGVAFEILDPNITDVLVVRAKAFGRWAHIYFGCNVDTPIFSTPKGEIKVFWGKIFYIAGKTNNIRYVSKHVNNLSGRIQGDRMDIGQPYNTAQVLITNKDYTNLNPYAPCGHKTLCLSSVSYWTAAGNRLKKNCL